MARISNHPQRASTILHKIFAIILFSPLMLANHGCQLIQNDHNTEKKLREQELLGNELLLIKKQLDEGKPEQAWISMRSLYPRYQSNQDVLNLAGLIHLSLDNTSKAISIFRQSHKLKPSTATGLNLSSAYIASGRYRKARAILVPLLRSRQPYPYRERLWHNYALTWEKERRLKSATKYYQKALNINPTYFLSLIRLAGIARQSNRERLAMKLYEKASRNCRSCFEPVNELASYYLNKGYYQRAARILREYLKQNQRLPDTAKQKAQNLLRLAGRAGKKK